MFAGKKSAQIREILISESAWEEMTCLFAPSLSPLPLKTKFKTADKAKFPSVQLDREIKILDLRFSKNVSPQYIVNNIQSLLNEKYPDARMSLLPDIEPDQIVNIEIDGSQCLLVLLDQTPGIIDDRYPLTQMLRTKAACQHINVNPFDLTGDPITDNLLIEQSTPDGDTRLIPATDSRYYDYSISDFEKKAVQESLARNVEIVYKELALKHLLLCNETKISVTLPQQKDLLTSSLAVITNGCLFTVKQDRPIILPFHPAMPDAVSACDNILCSFDTSITALLALLKEGANKQVISSQADSLIKISRIWADFFPANTSNQPI